MIERTDTEHERDFHIGRVTEINGGFLDTSIPINERSIMYEVPYVEPKHSSRNTSDEVREVIEAYKEYKKDYMNITIQDGEIKIQEEEINIE